MKVQLLQGQLQLSTGTATAYTQFEAARAQLDEGWAQYRSGQEQLDASRTEYETQKADAEQKLAEGQQQINDAEEKIADIQNGEWYVLDRGSTLSIVTLEQYRPTGWLPLPGCSRCSSSWWQHWWLPPP